MWISLSRQQQQNIRGGPSLMMPSAAHTSIPPPGPPARPGVLKFRPSSPHPPATAHSSSSTVSSATATEYSCFPPASSLVGNNVGVTASSHSHAAAASANTSEAANIGGEGLSAARCDASIKGRREGDRNKQRDDVLPPNAVVTPETLEGLPVPPPSRFKRFTSFIWGSKKERRKASEKNKTRKEKQKEPCSSGKEATMYHATAPQLPDEINENHEPSSLMGVMTAWGCHSHQLHERVSHESEGEPWHRNGPTRKSFRLTGHIANLSTERNMLPLWLEEETGEGVRQSGINSTNNKNETIVNDVSFESRWDSLTGRNMKRPSIPTVRPPGWENVGQQGKRKRKKTCKAKSNFCPSFTINDIPKDIPLQQTATEIQPLSPPVKVSIEPSPAPPTINQPCQSDAFDMSELSANVGHIFDDSFLQEQQRYSISTSNLAPQSASNTPSRTPSQTSTSAIADRHLWASSDSFICEDFSFCKGTTSNNRVQQEQYIPSQSPPRSYSQVLLSQPECNRNEFTDHDGMYADTEVHLQDEFPYEHILEQEGDFEADCSIQLKSTMNGNEIGMAAPCQSNYEGNNAISEYVLDDDITPYEDTVHLGSSNPTIRVAANSSRQKWIRFDNGSYDHLHGIPCSVTDNTICNSSSQDDNSFDFVYQSNHDMYRRDSFETTTSPTSPISAVVLQRNHSESTLNLVEPRLEQTPQTYKGQLVRSYSVRGRRASKRVTRTVSQKMKSSEYGKLTEPIPPMFSKAVLTMVSGPGLFERGDSPTDEMMSSVASAAQIKGQNELQYESSSPLHKGLSKSHARKQSSLSPGLPTRAGSLRVPHLPAIFVRRSVSLSAPKVIPGEVPFQRLPERRDSFRKAISGIGAIARSFRRRSGGIQNSTSASSHMAEKVSGGGPPSCLHRSGSIGTSFSRQIPKAPRLPRRAISHKQTPSYYET